MSHFLHHKLPKDLHNLKAKRKGLFCSLSSFALMLVVVMQSALPAMAQYQLEAEQDSLLPPEIVPLDPQMAKKMADSQAQARQQNGNFSNMTANDPVLNQAMNNNGGNMGNNNFQNSQQMRNDMMNGLMGQPNAMPNMGNNSMVPGLNNNNAQPPAFANNGTTTSSDWITPGQDPNSNMTAYGNVTQTQQLSAPSPHPTVRRDIRRSGISHAVSGLAGFGAGALVGTMIRRPNNLWGLGMTGAMMTGFGTRNAFRF